MKNINLSFDENGVAELYDDKYDIVIHCESEADQEDAMRALENARSWIPVAEQLPEENEWVTVTVKRHHWISDYDEKDVPEDEKTDHPEKVYCTLGRYDENSGLWEYIDLETSDNWPTAYFENDCSVEDLSYPMTEVIAWMPLPELYREET